MAEASPVQYVRLPGSGSSRRGAQWISVARLNCRLWLGDDHLLQVESAGGYSENYKRFYFRDIQAIVIRKTKNWFAWNVVLAFLTASALILVLSTMPKTPPSRWTGGEIAGGVFLGMIVAVFGLLFLINFLNGPTCSCRLKTAVHEEELPSLRRYRRAVKVLARIKPLIETAQGSLKAETLAPQYDALLAEANATTAEPGQVTRWEKSSVEPYRSRVHQILFITLLAEALMDLLHIFLPGLPVVLLNTVVGVVMCFAVITALVKQHQTDLKPAVRLLTWAAAVYVGLSYLVGYVIMMVVSTQQHLDGTQWGYLKGLAKLKPLEMTWLLGVLVVSAAISSILGAIGLLLLRDHWREKQTIQPPTIQQPFA
jgi:hypothetical protein